MEKGKINVSVDNIFPLIKKFLYSDQEIFLRELISNATDATLKLKHLTGIGEAKVEYVSPLIEVKVDKEGKTLRIIDQGVGMSEEEIKKYINEVAFSGAEEFLDKYKDSAKDAGIIGHFGLGFYSAFMVADKVEIFSKSYTDAPAVHWSCDGSPEFSLEPHDKTERGTEIVLHISEDAVTYLEESTIQRLLNKYSKFMPIPIKFGMRTETLDKPEGAKEDDPAPTQEIDAIINNPDPAWTKAPSDLKEEDYKNFYRELYPMQFEDPLFHIHLNVDYPFNLTGILFFPKLSNDLSMQKDRIQLYQNQVFVTDNVEGIVPEFLTMLKGVIDSPDIPLNVSRSYLQSDTSVKKITSYITRKVADKLQSLFKEDRKDFESKWNDIKVVIEYGMLTEEKFFEKAQNFALYPTTDEEFLTYEELEARIKDLQTDKEGKTVILYASNKDQQHSYIKLATQKGYTVLLLDSPIAPHLIQKLEAELKDVQFARVDADAIENLIKKEDAKISKLDESQRSELKILVEETVKSFGYSVQAEDLSSESLPFMLTEPEFMRRMKDMQQTGSSGIMGLGSMPDMYNLVVNTNHTLIGEILEAKTEKKRKRLVQQGVDLARLSKGILKGKDLADFISRSVDMIK
ncbi:MAG: molecular chaperone HtpG [Bacteroidetes bacterium]|nr:molecular chaperone HtpG [Bacteroidota bacterium]